MDDQLVIESQKIMGRKSLKLLCRFSKHLFFFLGTDKKECFIVIYRLCHRLKASLWITPSNQCVALAFTTVLDRESMVIQWVLALKNESLCFKKGPYFSRF